MSTTIDPSGTFAVLDRSGAIVSANSYSPFKAQGGIMQALSIGGLQSRGMKIAPWGANNLMPLFLLQLLADSNINAQLIATNVSFAMGRLYTFKWGRDAEGWEEKQPMQAPPEIERYLKSHAVRTLLRSRATDFFLLGNTWAKFKLARGGQGIAAIEHVDASCCRAELMNAAGKVKHYFVGHDWLKPSYKGADNSNGANVQRFPAFNTADPLRYFQSIHHSRLYWAGRPYYGIQPWHFGHSWISYGNKMPLWLSTNINKAHNIKYHIRYPVDYFEYLDNGQFETEEKKRAEKARVFNLIDDMLAGAENAQKTFFSEHKIDQMTGKTLSDWQIEAIPNDIKDEAFIKAYYASNVAAASAHGIDPSLANIQLEGRMPASGSQKRISYQMHELLYTEEVRQIMVEPLEIMRDVNGWPSEMQFGFAVRNIVTLAEDESGLEDPAKKAQNNV